MPYKNIVYAKLEKRLLNDSRWYMMSEQAQLNYIRFILLAQESYNRIPKDLKAIKKVFKTSQNLKIIAKTIKEIKKSFPKFTSNRHFFYFEDFHEKTNYVPAPDEKDIKKGIPEEIPGKSQGKPKEGADKEEDKDKEKEKKESQISSFFQTLKTEELKNLETEFGHYKEMRQKIKKPMTAHAEELILQKLSRLSLKNYELALAILRQSIENSWQGLFELKDPGLLEKIRSEQKKEEKKPDPPKPLTQEEIKLELKAIEERKKAIELNPRLTIKRTLLKMLETEKKRLEEKLKEIGGEK